MLGLLDVSAVNAAPNGWPLAGLGRLNPALVGQSVILLRTGHRSCDYYRTIIVRVLPNDWRVL